MLEKLKTAGLGVVLGAILALLGILGAFALHKPTVGPLVTSQKVDSVLVVRHDTIKVLRDSLRTKIVYIDTGRVDTVEKILDAEVPPIGDENICIAENQLRQCAKCIDSLEYTKKVIAIDSQVIDSLSKLAKTHKIEKACTLGEQAKAFGLGTLFGATLRSLF